MKTALLKKIFVCILLLSSIYNSFAQNVILSKKASVSVMTCGLGNEVYSLFGHTAIRVCDSENNLDIVYNYEKRNRSHEKMYRNDSRSR